MENENKEKKKFAKKLLHKYRLIILNEDTFEERISFKLTRLNVFVAVSLAAIFLIAATTVLIAFTGLREYIPGYSSTALKQRAAELAYKTDSLQMVMELNNQYYNSIRKVLAGDVNTVNFNRDSVIASQQTMDENIDLRPSKEDSLLREMVVQEDKYNIFETATNKANYALFAPVKGPVSEPYNLRERHFGVDIVTSNNAPVKAASEGTVIFAEWTAETGNVIILEHSYGLLSIYKHNSSLTKGQGEKVRKGEVIATSGSTGEFTTGPHLHFELWSEGQPLNPAEFIDFE